MTEQSATGSREPDMTPLFNIVSQCAQDSVDWFPDTVQDVSFLTIAALGELGEFANILKKMMRGSIDQMDPQAAYDLRMELTDVFIYICNIAAVFGLDLAAAYKIKREYNVGRFAKIVDSEENGAFGGI